MGLGQQAQNASKCSNGPTKQAWQVSTLNAHLNFKMGKAHSQKVSEDILDFIFIWILTIQAV